MIKLPLPFAASGLLTAATTAFLATGPVAPPASPAQSTMRYEVTFVPAWNPGTHPFEYPVSHARKGLLTAPIGATHDCRFAIFAPGTKPTPGLERLSEMGMHDPLDKEIEAAIKLGKAECLIRFDKASPGPVHASLASMFEVSRDCPMVSLVGMIAPSPDWFYGVSCVELCKDGQWMPSLVVPALAWDSGGDAGTTYRAEDQDLNPKQATMPASPAHFARNGKRCPVGYFVFKIVPVQS